MQNDVELGDNDSIVSFDKTGLKNMEVIEQLDALIIKLKDSPQNDTKKNDNTAIEILKRLENNMNIV